MKRKKFFIMLLSALIVMSSSMLTACKIAANSSSPSYEEEMVKLIADLDSYAKKNNPDFGLITNGGTNLYSESEYNSKENGQKLASHVVGALAESIFYGWDMTNNKKTPESETRDFIHNLNAVQEQGKIVLSLEYASNAKSTQAAYDKADKLGYIISVSPARELDKIPENIHNENSAAINNIKEIKNYLVLLNPDRYENKADYLQALSKADYDLIIIDAYFADKMLTADDVQRLKKKTNGKRRLVYAYLSIGEAERYRPYWQPQWEKNPPHWLAKENGEWQGNYKVKYWDKAWQKILYGTKESELDKILAAGFDGAFLDVVDAYEYFRDGGQ